MNEEKIVETTKTEEGQLSPISNEAKTTGLTGFDNSQPENMAQDMSLLATHFNATPATRCFVRFFDIDPTNPSNIPTMIVKTFDSQLEFMFYKNHGFDFGLNDKNAEFQIMDQLEIADYLLGIQQAIIENEKAKVEAKKVFEESKKLAAQMLELTGIGYMFQDTAGIVYKVNEPVWKSYQMEKVEITHTRYDDKGKGSLSLPEAREAGFIVEGEGKKVKKEKKQPEQNLSGEF